MNKTVDMQFTMHNPDGSLNVEKAEALSSFFLSWGRMKAYGASEDELEVLLRMAAAMTTGALPQIRGEVSKSDMHRAVVDAQTLLLRQFAHLGMSEQELRSAFEIATAKAFGRTS